MADKIWVWLVVLVLIFVCFVWAGFTLPNVVLCVTSLFCGALMFAVDN